VDAVDGVGDGSRRDDGVCRMRLREAVDQPPALSSTLLLLLLLLLLLGLPRVDGCAWFIEPLHFGYDEARAE